MGGIQFESRVYLDHWSDTISSIKGSINQKSTPENRREIQYNQRSAGEFYHRILPIKDHGSDIAFIRKIFSDHIHIYIRFWDPFPFLLCNFKSISFRNNYLTGTFPRIWQLEKRDALARLGSIVFWQYRFAYSGAASRHVFSRRRPESAIARSEGRRTARWAVGGGRGRGRASMRAHLARSARTLGRLGLARAVRPSAGEVAGVWQSRSSHSRHSCYPAPVMVSTEPRRRFPSDGATTHRNMWGSVFMEAGRHFGRLGDKL